MGKSDLWKQAERVHAKRFGGKRVPITGRQRGATPDIEHLILSPEVKCWRSFPEWLTSAFDQAKSAVRDVRQLPIVVLHPYGKRYDDDLILIRASDFTEYILPLLSAEQNTQDDSQPIE